MERRDDSLILIADPRVLSIPIQENNELIVDVRDQNALLFGPSPEIENNRWYTKMRSTVYQKLLQAQAHLPSGLRLCLYEGLRTIPLQEQLFEERWNRIKRHHPSWSDKEVYQECIRMVSPVETPDGKINIPPHSTGAAVDVYLVDSKTHLPIEMGILAKDWMQDEDGVLSCTHSKLISGDAQKNRDIMSWTMQSVGFVNYPTEYWHWSYGDRYWAFVQKQPFAFYGPVDEC